MAYRPLFGYKPENLGKRSGVRLKRGLAKHENWTEAILPADAEVGPLETETSKRPLWIVGVVAAGAFAIIVSRLFSLQIVEGARNLGLAEGNRVRHKITRAPRGVIYDREKQVLARNQANFDVTLTPQRLPKDDAKREEVYHKASEIIGISLQEIKKLVDEKGLNHLRPEVLTTNLERDKALLLDQSLGVLPGFALDVNPIREYLDAGQLPHILGYIGRVSEEELEADSTYLPPDYIGKLGIEKQYEAVLRGVNGSEQTEVDATEKPVKVLASKPSVPGSDVLLTIDKGLQIKLAESIQKQLDISGSKRASGIALNPKTGEVLASVSLPGYDNNLFSRGISQKDYSALANDPAQPLFNKPISGAFPTGSIIKPLVASSALQERVVTPQTTVNDTGQIEVVNKYDPSVKYTFRSYEASGHGIVNLYKAIALSSNVYFYTVGGGFGQIAGLGVERLTAYYAKFGLGSKSGIDIPGETAGYLPTPESKLKLVGEPWYTGDTYNISVGQGDLRVSPLQMAVATAAVANGGTIYKPFLLKSVLDERGQPKFSTNPAVVRQNFIDAKNLSVVREAMRQVVTSGTACCLIEKQVPVAVAAKTGTAETDPNGKRKPHGWFTAFAPYDDPTIVMVVLVENSGEGAQYAAPAVRETLTWYFGKR